MPETPVIAADAECGGCHHRSFEHCHDGCAVRQMYGGRYPCDCPAFELIGAADVIEMSRAGLRNIQGDGIDRQRET